jgi:hypothetical protein
MCKNTLKDNEELDNNRNTVSKETLEKPYLEMTTRRAEHRET